MHFRHQILVLVQSVPVPACRPIIHDHYSSVSSLPLQPCIFLQQLVVFRLELFQILHEQQFVLFFLLDILFKFPPLLLIASVFVAVGLLEDPDSLVS